MRDAVRDGSADLAEVGGKTPIHDGQVVRCHLVGWATAIELASPWCSRTRERR
jgi:hypothetical protein